MRAPSHFHLAFNLRTAKALDLEISPMLLECPLEIFLAVGLTADERMEAECHDPTRLLTDIVKLTEMIADHLAEFLPRLALADAHSDVIDLERIGHRHHSRDVKGEGLIVRTPVEDVCEAQLLQEPRCLERLGQSRSEPALDRLAG